MMACVRVATAGVIIAEFGVGFVLNPYPTPLPPSQEDIFMHYMPTHNLVVCGCGKCGTSSMYEYIYDKTIGHPWTYKWEPYIQDVGSNRWENLWQHVTDPNYQTEIMESAYSFALIRDPKERLISSWKSKLSCGDDFGVDYDSKTYVRNLRALQGLPRNDSMTCMSLDEFAEALLSIHHQGKLWRIDRHFLPQNYGCFDRFGPQHWTKLAAIEEPRSFSPLAKQLGTTDEEAPHEHGSTSKVFVSMRTAQILDVVTKQEYDMIGDYLPRESQVHSDIYASELRPNISFDD